jgi:hypothetical protein
MTDKRYLEIVRHLEKCLDEHGDSHLGIDEPNPQRIDIRSRIMLDMIRNDSSPVMTLLDFGCGSSYLYKYIRDRDLSRIQYSGLDISPKFIALSKQKFPNVTYYCMDVLENPSGLPRFDYIVMNGVFTQKQGLSFHEMFQYFTDVLSVIFPKANKGIAFNVMSHHVDWQRDDLFHLPLEPLTRFLTTKLSRHFVIRHDYHLYEYTVYLYR